MSTLAIGSLLHEGKAKRVHATNRQEVLAIEFKDDATAFNALKKAQLQGKGCMNCRISAILFEHLQQRGIRSHYLGVQGQHWMLVRQVAIIPIEVVVRNIAAGSLCRETPIQQGTSLEPPLMDLYWKDDASGDPLLNETRLAKLDLVTPVELDAITQLALQVNRFLQELFDSIELQLVDFKIELGRTKEGQLLLADEISPDTCRLWDRHRRDVNDRILDKDRFRQDLGNVLQAYGEVLKRVQGVCPEPRTYK